MTTVTADATALQMEGARRAAQHLGRQFCYAQNIVPIDFVSDTLTVGVSMTAKQDEVRKYIKWHTRVRKVDLVPMPSERVFSELQRVLPPQPKDETSQIKEQWEQILTRAKNLHAANILVEPTENGGQIRLDVDGDAERTWTYDAPAFFSRLVGHVTNVTQITDQNVGGNGKWSLEVDGRHLDLRVSSFPVWRPDDSPNKTKLVMRVLGRLDTLPSLDALGMDAYQREQFVRLMRAPSACVIVGAPTGQGKSSLINAGLRELDLEKLNVYSIEDPPEYYNPFITQTAVDTDKDRKWTIANALRSILRQDPKFVFVGEMREPGVASETLSAALTGIPIASTVHANSALTVFERLASLNVNADTISRAMSASISQRLVKVLCVHCRIRAFPSRMLAEAASYLGVGLRGDQPIYTRNPSGCEECFWRGVTHRIGIFEIMEVTENLKYALRGRKDDAVILGTARTEGFVTMFERALLAVLHGTIDELELVRRFVLPRAKLQKLNDDHPFAVAMRQVITDPATSMAHREETAA